MRRLYLTNLNHFNYGVSVPVPVVVVVMLDPIVLSAPLTVSPNVASPAPAATTTTPTRIAYSIALTALVPRRKPTKALRYFFMAKLTLHPVGGGGALIGRYEIGVKRNFALRHGAHDFVKPPAGE